MVTFNFTYTPGTTLQQMMGFEVAGRIWSTYLKDDATINIHAGMSNDMPSHVIGGALPGIMADQRYETWRRKMDQDKLSADDRTATSHMNSERIKFTSLIDGTKVDNNEELKLTRANAKALGMLSKTDAKLDGYILLNNLPNQSVRWSYDYQRSTTAPANTLDFLSTAIHEIGHILGFISGIDEPGWLTQKTQYDSNNIDDYYASLIGTLDNATPLDTFRYSTGSIKDNWIDLSVGGNPFFSINGGKTPLAFFATGKDASLGGSGYQASHWKGEGTSSGMMDATLSIGERASLNALDLRVFDVIGWDLVPGGMNTSLNLTALNAQAKQSLAQRLGVSASWLDANPAVAAQQIAQDRTQDVLTMIDLSAVYDKSRRRPNDPFGQLLDIFSQEGLFEQLTDDAFIQRGDRHQNQIFGSAKTDLLSGMAGRDQLVGRGGNDLVKGGRGEDWLNGGNGNDVLIGGRQCDRLMGGNGRDVFVLQVMGSCDVIQDFQDGEDQLGFSPGLPIERLGISQAGDNTQLIWDGKAIAILKGINAHQIDVSDFVAA
jgi:Ca2+-binding RTX toxin-like protein